MSWQNNFFEHAQIWRAATKKIRKALSKQDLGLAFTAFSIQHKDILDKKIGKETVLSIFNAWLFSCFHKDNRPLVPWFLERHGKELTDEEKEVLEASHESWFGVFKVKSQTKNLLVLTDVEGRKFIVETVDLTPLEKGAVRLARLFSKGNHRWFSPAHMIIADLTRYERLRKHRRFTNSYYKYLSGFFNYMHKEQGLSEATADKHVDNATVLTMFLDEKVNVDSFKKVTPRLLAEFKNYCGKYIHPKPVMHKMYYSLYWFYIYLEDKQKGQYNEKTFKWLGKKT